MSSGSTEHPNLPAVLGQANCRERTGQLPTSEVQYTLYRQGPRLTVRWCRWKAGTKSSDVIMRFTDRAAFDRWWHTDPMCFAHPVLHRQVARDADELWELPDDPARS